MDGELLSIGMSGRLLSTDDYTHPWAPRNLTRAVLDRLFPPIMENKVEFKHSCVFGQPGCGKTVLLNMLAQEARVRYGDDLNIIPCYAIRDALPYLNKKKAQLIIVDDAVSSANSRKPQQQADDVGDFYRIRHIYEERAKTSFGIVMTIWAAQRFKSLDVIFRNGNVLLFKTGATDPDDAALIRKYIGSDYYDRLCGIWDRIERSDDAAKTECVAYVPSAQLTGMFFGRLTPYSLHFVGAEHEEDPADEFFFGMESAVEEYKRKPRWKEKARVFELYHVRDMLQEDIGRKMDMKQSTVSEYISSMRQELARVSGLRYEAWKAGRLQRLGFDVDHRGGNGQADIIATDKDGRAKVYACKALYLKQKCRLSVEKELGPEIAEARRLGCPLVLSIYDLKARTELPEISVPVDRPPREIALAPA
jgi:hypothetical protein